MGSVQPKVIETTDFRWNVHTAGNPEHQPLIWLHGFSGSGEIFMSLADEILKRTPPLFIIAPDLPGHGKTELISGDESAFSADKQVGNLRELIIKMNLSKSPVLSGYSMGGRLAIQLAVSEFSGYSALIAESSTPGIDSDELREERRQLDLERAKFIQHHFNQFLTDWDNLPVFKNSAEIPEKLGQLQKQIRSKQSPEGLALSIKFFGTGSMPSAWNKLSIIKKPFLIITGELDEKFCGIGRMMASEAETASHKIIPDCGHRVHLESSNRYIAAITEFISSQNLS